MEFRGLSFLACLYATSNTAVKHSRHFPKCTPYCMTRPLHLVIKSPLPEALSEKARWTLLITPWCSTITVSAVIDQSFRGAVDGTLFCVK